MKFTSITTFDERVKGQLGIVGGVVAAIIGIILIFSALIPITNSLVGTNTTGYNTANISGYTGVEAVSQSLILFEVLGALLLIIGSFLVFRGG